MSPGPILETERLILRPTQAEDFEPWATFMADEKCARYPGGAQPRSLSWRGFLSMVGAWHIQGFATFSVIEKVSGCWVGRLVIEVAIFIATTTVQLLAAISRSYIPSLAGQRFR